MFDKLYYTKQEIEVLSDGKYVENSTTIYFTSRDAKFHLLKKLYLLDKSCPDVTKIYVEPNLYHSIIKQINETQSRYINLLDGYVFLSTKDYLLNLLYADQNRMF